MIQEPITLQSTNPMNWTLLFLRWPLIAIITTFTCFLGQAQMDGLDIEGIVQDKYAVAPIGELVWINEALGYGVIEENGNGLLHHPPPTFQRKSLLEVGQLG